MGCAMLILVFDTKEECDKFTYLYEKYYKMVFYTILKFIDDQFMAEDLLHEVYILIGKNLAKVDLDDTKRCRNFVITVTRNYCKSYLRKQKKINEEFMEDSDVLKGSKHDVLKDILDQEQREQLMDEVDRLEDKYKMVLELKYINGFHDNEIAELLSINKKNVQMRLYRAKRMLRERVGRNDHSGK